MSEAPARIDAVPPDATPKSDIAERAAAAFGGIRSMGDLLELPIVRQLSLLIGVSLAVAAGLMMFFWSQTPAQQAVFPMLSPEDSADLGQLLQSSGIAYKLDPATGALTVEPELVYTARMRAAQAGIPSSSGTGFELLQQDQGFGTSQFIEGARYQLAVETELARTIGSLRPVKAARVHLAMPKASAFTQGRPMASASVVLDLNPGQDLGPEQVDAIEHLVASSVPNLSVDAVNVIDQRGRLLSRRGQAQQDDPLKQTDEQYQHIRRIESDYVQRIRSLLAPMLGPNGVSAEVTAVVDFTRGEEASERYAPQGVVRSEQTRDETKIGDDTQQGIPGALSNQPPETDANAVAAANANGQVTEISKEATRNFEIDRTIAHRKLPVGNIQRLSVAVLVNHMLKPDASGVLVPTAPTEQELAAVEALVRQAVGFNAERGDAVTVQSAAFVDQGDAAEALPWWQRADVQSLARQLIGALVVLVLILTVVRPMMRALFGRPEAEHKDDEAQEALTADADAADAEDADGEDGEQASAAASIELLPANSPEAIAQQNAHEQRLALARQAVANDPKQVAQVIKGWLNEDG